MNIIAALLVLIGWFSMGFIGFILGAACERLNAKYKEEQKEVP